MMKILDKFYDSVDKIGKRNFILIIFIFIILMVTGLYQTFSIYTESEGLSIVDGIKTYSFILNANNSTNTVTIAAGESKNIDITVSNESVVDLKYKLYSSITSNDESNIFIGYLTNTANLPEGVIPTETSYVVTLKVYNYSEDDITIDFGVLYGLENAGELTLSSGQYEIEVLTLMKTMFNKWDGSYLYYRSDEYRNNIVTASFVDLDTTGMTESLNNSVVSWNISANGSNDESVVAWLSTNSTDNTKYDLYIGAKEKIYTDSLYAMFSQMSALKNVSFDNLDSSLATDIAFLFKECTSLIGSEKETGVWELDLSSLDTSNVTNMWAVFGNCSSLTNLDLSGFNTSNVTSMSNMFIHCSSLTGLDLSNFNTSNVTTMTNMFSGCTSMETLTLGTNFVGTKLIDTFYMFLDCSSLTSLNLSNFNTPVLMNAGGMFSGCGNLENLTLDLDDFDTSNVTNFNLMFYNCSKLHTEIVIRNSTATTPTATNMFSGAGTGGPSDPSITVYYTNTTQTLVNNIVGSNSNIKRELYGGAA